MVSLRILFTIVFFVYGIRAMNNNPIKLFDVRTYGARGDGKTDNTKAFMKTWSEACDNKGGAKIYVPTGTYMLGEITFKGNCKGPIAFVIEGTLRAPSDPKAIKQQSWIVFRYIDDLTVTGGGILDGQGQSSWPLNDCLKNPNCPAFPVNIAFQFVKYSRIENITSLNSKMGHVSIFACSHLNITGVTITAPRNSPNTDGIKIGASDNIKIVDTNIGTGDDCIAVLGGNSEIKVHGGRCGPGHGISVGSLGRYKEEKDVTVFSVRDVKFVGTDNGIRIKTWPTAGSEMKVSEFEFHNLEMVYVKNPVIIDQKYCPVSPCAKESDSHVQIQNISFDGIYGTSASKVAVSIECSKSFPCKDIKLKNINLVHKGKDGPAVSQCSHVLGKTLGIQNPSGCLGR